MAPSPVIASLNWMPSLMRFTVGTSHTYLTVRPNNPEGGKSEMSRRKNWLALAAGGPDLHLDIYGPANVADCVADLLPYRALRRLGQRQQRLTGRATAALKGAIVRIEGWQHEAVLLNPSLDGKETSFDEEQFQALGVSEREGPGGGLRQGWHVLRQNDS